jgi:hypothetical protein
MEASITLKVQSEAHGAVGPDGVRRSTQVTALDLVPVVPRVTVGGVQFPSPTPLHPRLSYWVPCVPDVLMPSHVLHRLSFP